MRIPIPPVWLVFSFLYLDNVLRSLLFSLLLLAVMVGLEPTPFGLTDQCSAIEPHHISGADRNRTGIFRMQAEDFTFKIRSQMPLSGIEPESLGLQPSAIPSQLQWRE